ncbi:exopolysaccharide biosynthesis protein exod [Brevundimonas sp. GN22]|uniref:exopolysaccharide biosynthesis protein n=1 Tax=Brevundimonas pishanensis TaxID=2896315 RepID=UPI001FA732A2|nr:exopolysaccharide biosynthesis protein [Brevundimonas pishanensis]
MPTTPVLKTSDERRTFSDVLESLGYGSDPKLTIREMVEAFGERGFGAMLLLLALMALFPWPPGGKAVFSVPIILLSIEMAFQKSRLWLPAGIMRSNVQRETYRRLLNSPVALPRWARSRLMAKGNGTVARWWRRRIAVRPKTQSPLSLLRAAERLTRPRWPFMTGELADTLIGVACILLAVMMALPVPFGDMLPGLAIAVLSLGIVQRDGVFILLGAIGTAASGIYLMLVWKTVAAIGSGIIGWFDGLF